VHGLPAPLECRVKYEAQAIRLAGSGRVAEAHHHETAFRVEGEQRDSGRSVELRPQCCGCDP